MRRVDLSCWRRSKIASSSAARNDDSVDFESTNNTCAPKAASEKMPTVRKNQNALFLTFSSASTNELVANCSALQAVAN